KLLASLIAAPKEAPTGDDIFDLFDDCPYAHRKRPLESNDIAMSHKRPRTDDKVSVLEEQITDAVVQES
ncbi:MAG: hypothetical protein Q8834_02950, partial [Candidatus Phytoplasma australasiaticum]|nr:hypothetical protein [Candidatus Phytoplasma australasiaticum]